jgi:putative ABC transport system permease protein
VRLTDMLGLAFSSLRQHKVRTALTTLGVVFGSLVLAASLSIGQGVQQVIRKLRGDDLLRRVQVWPNWEGASLEETGKTIQVEGEMSDTRRERIRKALARRKARSEGLPQVSLSQVNVAALRELEHLEDCLGFAWQDGYAVLDEHSERVQIGAARPRDPSLGRLIVAGKLFERTDSPSVVVNEALLYLLGVTDESAVEGVLGRTLRIEARVRPRPGLGVYIKHAAGGPTSRQDELIIQRITSQLPRLIEELDLAEEEKVKLRELVTSRPSEPEEPRGQNFTIVGVVRAPTQEEQNPRVEELQFEGDVVLPFRTSEDLFFHLEGENAKTLHMAFLIVDREENVEQVLARVREMGYEGYAPLEHLKRERLVYLLIFGGMTCVAVVALLVAGLGIANTMLISVLQRTREIGIMKAVGADSRHLQFVFLIEGAIIGSAGGILGLLLAWGSSFVTDSWIRSIAARDLKIDLTDSLWAFPLWLPIGVFLFAVAVTVTAAVYPSRRAARVDPVVALRHE